MYHMLVYAQYDIDLSVNDIRLIVLYINLKYSIKSVISVYTCKCMF